MSKPAFPQHLKVDNAAIEWLDSGLPYSRDFEDIYHSQYGNNPGAEDNSNSSAQDESSYVFLQANRLKEQWLELSKAPPGKEFSIAELGFGAGLNFLLCWRLWRETAPAHCCLHYTAIEKFPISLADLERIHQLWPELADLSTLLLEHYQDHSKGIHRLHFDDNRITLDLCFDDASDVLHCRENHCPQLIDCWFLDGFSPRCNPSMWSSDLVEQIAKNSNSHSTLSSYSVSSSIRKPLKEHGFTVEKLPGYGRKRHMLFARYDGQAIPSSQTSRPSWFIPSQHTPTSDTSPVSSTPASKSSTPASKSSTPLPRSSTPLPRSSTPLPRSSTSLPRSSTSLPRSSTSLPRSGIPLHIAVIGAGLAGCSTAFSLAQKGCRVSVLEKNQEICQGASGNSQAAVQLQLSHSATTQASLKLTSYLYAIRQYNAFARAEKLDWQQCGLLQTSHAFNRKKPPEQKRLGQLYDKRVLVTAGLAKAFQHLAVGDLACFLPQAGWLCIAELCDSYLNHPNIELRVNSQATALKPEGEQWLIDINAADELHVDRVVIANSYDSEALISSSGLELKELPLQTSKGQVTHINPLEHPQINPSALPVICGTKTLFPLHRGIQTIAASYQIANENANTDMQQNEKADFDNISVAARLFSNPDISAVLLRTKVLSNRKSTRCNSRDFMPIVGQAFNQQETAITYARLAKSGKGSRHIQDLRASQLPGLYLNIAHGSHGLSSCPLMAEFLASKICGHRSPLTMAQSDSINPIRFLMRNLSKP